MSLPRSANSPPDHTHTHTHIPSSEALLTPAKANTNANAGTSPHIPSPTEIRIAALKEEIAALRQQLGDHDPEIIVQRHINLLHTYNEIKDGTQSLISHGILSSPHSTNELGTEYKLAQLKGTTIKKIHEELDLPLTG